jgi:hypothetical protein
VVRLAEHLFSTPILTAASAQSLLGVTRPTAHAAIDALVERGDLHEVTGREGGRVYEAPRIFDAVYGPVDVGGGHAPDSQLRLELGERSLTLLHEAQCRRADGCRGHDSRHRAGHWGRS